jgi:hypothetical protein
MSDPTNTDSGHPSLVTVVGSTDAPDPTNTHAEHPSTVTRPSR